jgi:hypothetical protein
VAKEARTLDASRAVSGPANAALRAAALLAVKLGAFHEHKEALAVLQAARLRPRLSIDEREGGFRAARLR